MEYNPLMNNVAQIVSAYVAKNTLSAEQLMKLITDTYTLMQNITKDAEIHTPAVQIKKSIHPDYIICLEDGKKLKVLTRYILKRYNLTPEAYRTKWGLPSDYPMVAQNYADTRSQIAKSKGFGKKIQKL